MGLFEDMSFEIKGEKFGGFKVFSYLRRQKIKLTIKMMKQKLKRLNQVLALMLTMVALMVGQNVWAQGTGTIDDPYEIGSYAELKDFVTMVNGIDGYTGNANPSACAKLVEDIVCKEYPEAEEYSQDWFHSIGTASHPYTGTFDGNGHTIAGVSTPVNTSSDYMGLFGYIGSGGVVKNVIVKDATLKGNNYVGVIVGYNNGGTLTNNYYLECSVNNFTTNIGTGSGDCDGARRMITTSYVEADGTAHEDVQAILLDNTMTTLAAGTYVVNSDVTYTSTVTITGNVTLILADGYTMTVGTSESRINGYGINKPSGTATLTIYGQNAGSGALSIYTTDITGDGISVSALTINGGNVTANANGSYASALFTATGDITINGGTVSATGSGSGYADAIYTQANFIYNGGNVTANGGDLGATGKSYTFSWRNLADRIAIAGIFTTNDVTATFSKTFTDGNNTYSGTLTGEELNALAGKTLYPYIEELDLSANLAPDGNYWTTFYCSHTNYLIHDGENATAYTAEVKSGSIKLHSLGKDVPKNTAVIIKGEDDEISMTKCEDPDLEIPANDLDGVDVQTAISSLGDGTLYVLGKTTVGTEKHFGFHKYTGTTMAARKAFLLISGGDSSNFFGIDDETTGIHSVDGLPFTVDSFFDLSGRKVTNPTKGLYIMNGKKVVYNR